MTICTYAISMTGLLRFETRHGRDERSDNSHCFIYLGGEVALAGMDGGAIDVGDTIGRTSMACRLY